MKGERKKAMGENSNLGTIVGPRISFKVLFWAILIECTTSNKAVFSHSLIQFKLFMIEITRDGAVSQTNKWDGRWDSWHLILFWGLRCCCKKNEAGGRTTALVL